MKTYRLYEAGIYLAEDELKREYEAFADREKYPTFDAWLDSAVDNREFYLIKGDWFIARTADDIYLGEYDTLKEAKEAVKELEAEDKENGDYSRDAYKILPTNDAQLYMLVDDRTAHGAVVEVETFDSADEAIERASYIWDHLNEGDKKRTDAFYVLLSAYPDEEDERHFEGDIVASWKGREGARKWITCDRDTGSPIDDFGTYEEAEAAIKGYESEDEDEDNFAPNFYEAVLADAPQAPTYALANSLDGDISFTSPEEAKRYYRQDENAEWYSEDEKAFNAALDACESLQDIADVLNTYADTIGNGSHFCVKEV